MSKLKKLECRIEHEMTVCSGREFQPLMQLAADAIAALDESETECQKLRETLQSVYDDVYGCPTKGCDDAVATMEGALGIRGEQGF